MVSSLRVLFLSRFFPLSRSQSYAYSSSSVLIMVAMVSGKLSSPSMRVRKNPCFPRCSVLLPCKNSRAVRFRDHGRIMTILFSFHSFLYIHICFYSWPVHSVLRGCVTNLSIWDAKMEWSRAIGIFCLAKWDVLLVAPPRWTTWQTMACLSIPPAHYRCSEPVLIHTPFNAFKLNFQIKKIKINFRENNRHTTTKWSECERAGCWLVQVPEERAKGRATATQHLLTHTDHDLMHLRVISFPPIESVLEIKYVSNYHSLQNHMFSKSIKAKYAPLPLIVLDRKIKKCRILQPVSGNRTMTRHHQRATYDCSWSHHHSDFPGNRQRNLLWGTHKTQMPLRIRSCVPSNLYVSIQ